MSQQSGYVLINYRDLSIETSLWFMVVFLVFLFIMFHLLLRFSSGVGSITLYIRQWINNRRWRRAHTQTILGLYDLVEGNWERAEKKLARSAKYSDMPAINYLAAAFMAQNQHEFKRRDNYLHLVTKVAQDHPIVVGVTQANLYMINKYWEEAGAILRNLHNQYPKNAFILQLLHQVYLELRDWSSLEKILPALRKRRVLNVDALGQLEQKVYKEMLIISAQDNSITTVWKNLPRYLQRVPEIVAVYSQYLLSNNQLEDAETILKMTLRKVLDAHLLKLYAALDSSQPIKQLMRAEEWLQHDQENADLLLCLGCICRRQKLWGKARHYLEKSARLKPVPIVYSELAQIIAAQGDLRAALDTYAKSHIPPLANKAAG